MGAGGLVRAYSSSAAENLSGADVRRLEMCEEWEIRAAYTDADAVKKFISSQPCPLLSCDYAEKVTFIVAVRKAEAGGFLSALVDFARGRAETEKKGEYYLPFPEKR